MPTVISSNKLGKQYFLSHQSTERHTALRDAIASGSRQLLQKLRNPFAAHVHNPKGDEFWALKDVSFDIDQGDRVGIIGQNGAGKSTLLKILSHLTEPTVGRIEIEGRVASLLEVGTGFHPELTGRENIYLNGAILGMTKSEIRRKFDEIVAFADVEKFLDTPVKRYSSGMYVRLGFAVAAHLEPEILIVDEVLAVGDVKFQKKCLGLMKEAGSSGKTVLFVSHNMEAIEHLCTSAILLDNGSISHHDKDVRKITREYLNPNASDELASPADWTITTQRQRNPWFNLSRFCIVDRNSTPLTSPITNDSDAWVQIEGDIVEIDPAIAIGYQIYSGENVPLYWSCQLDGPEKNWPKLNTGLNKLRSKIPCRLLNEGSYRIELLVGICNRQWIYEPDGRSPTVHLAIRGGLSDSPYFEAKRPGILAPIIEWHNT